MEQNTNSDFTKEFKETKDKDFKEFGRQFTKTTFKKRDSIFSNESANGFNSVLFLASEFTVDSDSEAIIPIKKRPDISEIATLKRNSVQIEANYSKFPFNFQNSFQALENIDNKELDLDKEKATEKLKTQNLLNINPMKIRRFSTPNENICSQVKTTTETTLEQNISIKSKETEIDSLHTKDYFQTCDNQFMSRSRTYEESTSLNNNLGLPVSQIIPGTEGNLFKSSFKKQNTFTNASCLNNNMNFFSSNTYHRNDNFNNTNHSISNSEFSSSNPRKTLTVNNNPVKPILLINNQPVQSRKIPHILENQNNLDGKQHSPGLWNRPLFPMTSNSSTNVISSIGGTLPSPSRLENNNLLGCSNQGMSLFTPYSPTIKPKENIYVQTSPLSNCDSNYMSSNLNSPSSKVKIPLPHFQQPITMNTMVYHNLLVSQHKKPSSSFKKENDNPSFLPVNTSSAEEKRMSDSTGNVKISKKDKIKKKQNTRDGDWICLECQNLNFSFRNVCNKCSYERKIDGKT